MEMRLHSETWPVLLCNRHHLRLKGLSMLSSRLLVVHFVRDY
jgi:hypothetical protein